MTSEELKKYKNIYTEIQISHAIVEEKWSLLQQILPEQHVTPLYYRYLPYGAAFLGVIIFVSVVTIGFAQTAAPGTFLYPVKALTKKLSTEFVNSTKPQEQISQVKSHPIVNVVSTITPSVPTPTAKQKQTSLDENGVKGASIHMSENHQEFDSIDKHSQIQSTNIPSQSVTHTQQGNGNTANERNVTSDEGKSSGSGETHNSGGSSNNNSHGNDKNNH